MINLLSLVFTITCIFSFNNSLAQEITTLSGKKIMEEDLERKIKRAMDSLEIPGLSIAIINQNQVVYHRAMGVTDRVEKTAVTEKTLFEAASLSKPMFAYFVMKMADEGQLDIDEPIYPYLADMMSPEVIESSSLEYYKMLTPRIILSHGSGMSNWANGKPIKISFKPGTDFSYSGEAYQHLGAALGMKLSIGWGGALDSLFLDQVAHPLNMYNTFFTWNEKLEKYKAKGHKDGIVNQEIHRDKKVGPGYSLHSEAHDFALFLIEMMDPKNIDKAFVKEMLKEQNQFGEGNELIQQGQTGWGLGFARRPTQYGIRFMHTGNNRDFQAYCAFYPERKYGLVFFMNCDKIEPFYSVLGEILDDKF